MGLECGGSVLKDGISREFLGKAQQSLPIPKKLLQSRDDFIFLPL